VQTELDLAQLAVAALRWSQPSEQALVLAAWIVDDDLDRVDAVGCALGGPAVPARKLGQVGAQLVIEGLVEARSDHAALARG
jgi:hypothetical protein